MLIWWLTALTHLPVWFRSENTEMKDRDERLLNFMPQWTFKCKIWLPFSGRVKLRTVAGPFDRMMIQNIPDYSKKKFTDEHLKQPTVSIMHRDNFVLSPADTLLEALSYPQLASCMFSYVHRHPLWIVSWRNHRR